MTPLSPSAWTAEQYEQAAEEYLAKLPLEHFMEAIPSATQRAISLYSLELLQTRRGKVQVYNELLVQYFYKGRLRRVVPDNLVQLSARPCSTKTSYNPDLEGEEPAFWAMEYVSPSSRRKDYGASFRKYEKELKLPYCMLFYPENQDLRLYRHDGKKYVRVTPNEAGRLPIPELELELALLDGWVRFWYQGELLPLPADLQKRVEALVTQLQVMEAQADELRRRAEEERKEAEKARAQADEERKEAEKARARADEERKEAEKARAQADEERKEAEKARSEAATAQIDAQREREAKEVALRRAEQLERQQADMAAELARLRAALDRETGT